MASQYSDYCSQNMLLFPCVILLAETFWQRWHILIVITSSSGRNIIRFLQDCVSVCTISLLTPAALIHLGVLTLPMLRLLLSKAHRCNFNKDFWKPSKPCHVGIYWKALTEYCQMSTHLPGFQSCFVSVFFLGFSHHFVLPKLATCSIRVNTSRCVD